MSPNEQETEMVEVPTTEWIECYFCFGEGCPECGFEGGAYVIEDEISKPLAVSAS
jgi:hypothetical protein